MGICIFLLIFLTIVGIENLLVLSKSHAIHFESLAPILVVISIFVLWGSYLFSKRLFQPLQAIESWINKNKFDTNNQNYKILKQDYGVMKYNRLANFINQSFSELKHTVEANAELSLEKIKAERGCSR